MIANANFAFIKGGQAVEAAQQRRFAAARRTNQGDRFAVADVQRNPVEDEARSQQIAFNTSDMQEGLKAFMERREPRFTGA